MNGTEADPYAGVVGQEEPVARLRTAAQSPVHAYLLVGNPGSGSRAAAHAFAGELLADGLVDGAADRARQLALAGTHPDLVIIEAEGAALRVGDAEFIINVASTTPVEGARKVILIHRIDVIEQEAVGKLLKIVEEPPPGTFFVALAGELTPELSTIASRCVTVEFWPLSAEVIERALQAEGVPGDKATMAATAAGGDLDRARLLANDPAIAHRAELWRQLPERLDGTGHRVWEFTRQIREAMDEAAEPLEERHARELAELELQAEQRGERGLGRARVIARHKRELRKLRSDEIRFGLATLSRGYRDRLLAGPDPRAARAVERTQFAAVELVRNPNESLFLQSLLLDLGG
jgi:DNA polymerase-3 subunit delta'